jgi:uncharacterized protein (TIGR00369 family)
LHRPNGPAHYGSVRVTGLEIMRAIASGVFPNAPAAVLLGMECTEVADGHVRFTANAAAALTNPQGTIHGGIVATLLDTAMTCAIFTKLPAGKSCTTTDFSVQFLRPLAPDDGVMTADGYVLNVGKTRATARAELTNAAGKLCAYATSGAAIFDLQLGS